MIKIFRLIADLIIYILFIFFGVYFFINGWPSFLAILGVISIFWGGVILARIVANPFAGIPFRKLMNFYGYKGKSNSDLRNIGEKMIFIGFSIIFISAISLLIVFLCFDMKNSVNGGIVIGVCIGIVCLVLQCTGIIFWVLGLTRKNTIK